MDNYEPPKPYGDLQKMRTANAPTESTSFEAEWKAARLRELVRDDQSKTERSFSRSGHVESIAFGVRRSDPGRRSIVVVLAAIVPNAEKS